MEPSGRRESRLHDVPVHGDRARGIHPPIGEVGKGVQDERVFRGGQRPLGGRPGRAVRREPPAVVRKARELPAGEGIARVELTRELGFFDLPYVSSEDPVNAQPVLVRIQRLPRGVGPSLPLRDDLSVLPCRLDLQAGAGVEYAGRVEHHDLRHLGDVRQHGLRMCEIGQGAERVAHDEPVAAPGDERPAGAAPAQTPERGRGAARKRLHDQGAAIVVVAELEHRRRDHRSAPHRARGFGRRLGGGGDGRRGDVGNRRHASRAGEQGEDDGQEGAHAHALALPV